MSSIIEKILLGNKKTAPGIIQDALKANFDDAINIEWHTDKIGCWEAIFYRESLEHIAKFDCTANLIEYKINLTDEHLPLFIKEKMETKGEIMNYVLINRRNQIMYEVIYRLSPNERFLVTLSETGKILEEKRL